MSTPVTERVRKRRAALKVAGRRSVHIWVPYTRRRGFADECRRQAILAAIADSRDPELSIFLDGALAEADDLADERSEAGGDGQGTT